MRLTFATALPLILSLASALPTQPTDTPTAANAHKSCPLSKPTPTPTLATQPKLLEPRQGAVVTEAPAAVVAGQIPPVTTVQIGQVKNGAYVQVEQVYTQTFNLPVDQWPSATSGSIGLGTIQGQIGVVKTKRDLRSVPTDVPVAAVAAAAEPVKSDEEVLTLEGLREMMASEQQQTVVDDRVRELVLTTEEFNKILAAMPVEEDGAVHLEMRGAVITKEMLDKLAI